VGQGEEYHVGAGYGGDGTGGAEDGSVGDHDVAKSAEYAAGEVEEQVAEVAQFVVYVIAKDVEEEHVADEVHPRAVEEGVGDELIDGRRPGGEGEVLQGGVALGGDEDYDVDDDQGVVYGWVSAEGVVGADGDDHL
jgi:hypothetical protein